MNAIRSGVTFSAAMIRSPSFSRSSSSTTTTNLPSRTSRIASSIEESSIGVGEWVGVQVTGQIMSLPGRDGAPSMGSAVPLGLGGGLRFKLPYRYPVAPWVDVDLLYVRTGSLERLGYTVGAGVHIPVGADR